MQNASTKRTLRQIGLGVLFVVFCCLMTSLGQAQPGGPRIVINIPATTLYLYSGDTILRSYPVGVGKPGFKTPLGRYQVIRKVTDPGWENPYLAPGRVQVSPGEDNPLGSRWIGFKESAGGEYGIHGTDNPGSVGKYSSHGCVRMRTPDAEDLFNRISVGTPVEIKYDLVSLSESNGKVSLRVYADAYGRGYPSAPSLHQRIMTTYPGMVVQPPQLMAALKSRTSKPMVVAAVHSDSVPMDDRLAMGGESDLVLKGGTRSLKNVQTDVPVHIAQATTEKPVKPQPKAPQAPQAKAPPPVKAAAKPVETKPAAAKPEATSAPAKAEAPKTEQPIQEKAPEPKAKTEQAVPEPPPISAKPSIPFSNQLHQIQQKIPHVDMPSGIPVQPTPSMGLVLILAIIGAFVIIRVMVLAIRKFSQVKATLQAMSGEPDHATVMGHEPMMLRDEPAEAPQPQGRSPYVTGQQIMGQQPQPIPSINIPDSLYNDEEDEDLEEEPVNDEAILPASTNAEGDEDWPSTDLEDEAEEEALKPRYEQPVQPVMQATQLTESPFLSSLERYLSLSQQQQQQ